MKILDSYTRMAKQLIVEQEVDDDKIIKYKDKEGESQEMTAGAAKKQPDDHPAKIAYNKMKDSDGGEKDSGGKLGGSDFERDFDDKSDEPKGKSKDDNAESDDIEISDANSGPIDTDDIMDMLKNDSEVVNKMGDDVYWDGTDLVSSKFDDDTIASVDGNMTLGDLKKQIMDYEGEEDDDEPKDSKVDIKNIDSFDDAKKVIDHIVDRKDEASEMEQNFYEDSEYQKVEDTLDDETKDVFYDNVKGKLTDLWLELARHIDQDMESVQYGEYDDDENDQKEIIQQLKKDNDKLSNDAKEFIDNPKNYLKKLINSFDSKDESIKVINGKKYKAIKESKEHIFKKTYKKIGGK